MAATRKLRFETIEVQDCIIFKPVLHINYEIHGISKYITKQQLIQVRQRI
jgi:hypothetical protein